nr:immunoglobulin heavy chain junction region [Mus musculus]
CAREEGLLRRGYFDYW